jgi:hypothetical protein
MPDTLKQFYNATIDVTGLTGDQTATLFTNNSTTRAVIKDIDVANTFPATPNLTVAGTIVASLGSNLTGSEIIDVSQAVAMSFSTPLTYASSTAAYLNSTGVQRVATAYTINGTQVSSTTVDQATPALESGANYVTAVYYAPDGDVFSAQTNGDANWYMLKNAGSASGTRTTINTGNTTNFSSIAFDGVNTFYWFTSTTNLRAYNADTETTTNTTVATLPGASSRSRLVHSNGYLLYASSAGNYLHIVEISTGRWALFNSITSEWTETTQFPGFWFEPSTRVATFMYFFSGNNLYYRHISPTIPAFTSGSQTISTSWSAVTRSPSSFAGRGAATSSIHIVLSSADGGVMLDGSIFPSVLSGLSGDVAGWTLTGPLSSANAAVWRPRRVVSLSPTLNTTNFPNTISLRVTGVEVTP